MSNSKSNSKSNSNLYIAHIYDQLVAGEAYLRNISFETDTILRTECVANVEDDKYLPGHIREYILQNIKQSVTYKATINGKNIRLTFSSTNAKKPGITQDQLKSAFLIIYLLSLYGASKCSTQLDIDIFLTSFKKQLPSNPNQTIGAEHVNTGLSTYGCNRKSEIVIYREEEWFKVMIHELFHNFHLDFSTRDIKKAARALKAFCGVESDFAIYETYCETWARILNCCVESFIISQTPASYLKKFNKSIQLERLFSLKQADLILKRFKNPADYKEDSNVFCYYVLTASLMNDYAGFIEWCHISNPTILKFQDTAKNVDAFARLIMDKLEDPEFNRGIALVKRLNVGNTKSLRMTT